MQQFGQFHLTFVSIQQFSRKSCISITLGQNWIFKKMWPSKLQLCFEISTPALDAKVRQEIKSGRIQWIALEEEEQKLMEELVQLDPQLGIFFIRICFKMLEEKDVDENRN